MIWYDMIWFDMIWFYYQYLLNQLNLYIYICIFHITASTEVLTPREYIFSLADVTETLGKQKHQVKRPETGHSKKKILRWIKYILINYSFIFTFDNFIKKFLIYFVIWFDLIY